MRGGGEEERKERGRRRSGHHLPRLLLPVDDRLDVRKDAGEVVEELKGCRRVVRGWRKREREQKTGRGAP